MTLWLLSCYGRMRQNMLTFFHRIAFRRSDLPWQSTSQCVFLIFWIFVSGYCLPLLLCPGTLWTVPMVSWASWASYLKIPYCMESPSLFVEKEKLWLLCLRFSPTPARQGEQQPDTIPFIILAALDTGNQLWTLVWVTSRKFTICYQP